MRTESIRREIQRLIQQRPFRRFVMTLENGDRILVEHPENIAFDPGENGKDGSIDFYIISKQLRFYSTFDAVDSITLTDNGRASAA